MADDEHTCGRGEGVEKVPKIRGREKGDLKLLGRHSVGAGDVGAQGSLICSPFPVALL